jgi:hypothetical protein
MITLIAFSVKRSNMAVFHHLSRAGTLILAYANYLAVY